MGESRTEKRRDWVRGRDPGWMGSEQGKLIVFLPLYYWDFYSLSRDPTSTPISTFMFLSMKINKHKIALTIKDDIGLSE